MVTSKSCADCLKENVCKYKEQYNKDIRIAKQQDISAITNIHIDCKEFFGKPQLREWGSND